MPLGSVRRPLRKILSLASQRHAYRVAACLAGILFSGTCELDPPTTPATTWEFSADGNLTILDGPRGPMSRLQISFTAITPPPANGSYEVVVRTLGDSVIAGPLPVRASGNAQQAQVTWDEPRGQLIFGRYDGLHLNLVGEIEALMSRRSIALWWSTARDSMLQVLFAESGSALQLIERGDELVALSIGIASALSVDSAKAKGRRMEAQLQGWHAALGDARSSSAALVDGLTQFSSTLAEIEERSVRLLQSADILASLVNRLVQSEEDSVPSYNLLGFDLNVHASALQYQSTAIYTLCQHFAALDVAVRPPVLSMR